MSDLISREEAIEAVCNNKEDTYYALENLPSEEAIPVSWIEERIENAIKAKQTLIARMWQELIVGYMREKK